MDINKRKDRKYTNCWKINTTLQKSRWKLNKNQNTAHQNGHSEGNRNSKVCITVCVIKIFERSQTNNLMMSLKTLEEQGQPTPQKS